MEAHQVIRFTKYHTVIFLFTIPPKRIHAHTRHPQAHTQAHTRTHTQTHTQTHTHTHTHTKCNRPMALQFKLLTNIKF